MPDATDLLGSVDAPIDADDELRAGREAGQADAKPLSGKVICVIDESPFIRECIRCGLELFSGSLVRTFPSPMELIQERSRLVPDIVLILCMDSRDDDWIGRLDELHAADGSAPVVVLGPHRTDLLDVVIAHKAKGYIPFTAKLEVVTEIMRVILAGGTYAPIDCLPNPPRREEGETARENASKGHPTLTARELSVVRAIQMGKSNKAIAYTLNMTESTVKAHVRNVMAKLNAKNRTEVAMMSERQIVHDGEYDA